MTTKEFTELLEKYRIAIYNCSFSIPCDCLKLKKQLIKAFKGKNSEKN